jgi:polyhydroxyalkanoate synthase
MNLPFDSRSVEEALKTQAPFPNSVSTEPMSFDTLDHVARALMARVTQGVSPQAQMTAWLEWSGHLSRAPGRQIELSVAAYRSFARLSQFAVRSLLSNDAELPFAPAPQDRRFADPAWKTYPYALFMQAFLSQEDWWSTATREIRGMTPNVAARAAFMARQKIGRAHV